MLSDVKVFKIFFYIYNSNTICSKMQRKTLLNLLHIAGILISNIGMEKYEIHNKQAIQELSILVQMRNSIINATNFLKIVLIFIFANSFIKTGNNF